MATRRGVKGRWVFVPLPNWERLPPDFYCLRRSRVVLTLFFRNLPLDLYDYCVTNAVLPPAGLSYTRLVKFITEHRTAAQAVCGPALPMIGNFVTDQGERSGSSSAAAGDGGRPSGQGSGRKRDGPGCAIA